MDAGVEYSVWAQLADLERRGKLVRADLESCVLTTAAALNWNRLCVEVVSSTSRYESLGWRSPLGAHGERTPESVRLDDLQGPA